MIKSMTGYGKVTQSNDDCSITVEIKSLNSRYFEISTRLPSIFSEQEDKINKFVKDNCSRGKIALYVSAEFVKYTTQSLVLNADKLNQYLDLVEDINKELQRDETIPISQLLKIPEVVKVQKNEISEEFIKLLFETVKLSLEEMENIRKLEGQNLQVDIEERINKIQSLSKTVDEKSKNLLPGNLEKYKERLNQLTTDYTFDDDRLYQEVAILIDKKDVTEELIRLNSHIQLFNTILGNEEIVGKKLNFLIQELGREINTIGSKTDIVEVSHLVVEMKNELEKIREQVQNIV